MMKTNVHNFTSTQVHLNIFDNSNDFATIPETAVTLTGNAFFKNSETGFTLNPFYSCRPRRGYSLTADIFNMWKRQEEISHYSRGDIKRAYRLGEWY